MSFRIVTPAAAYPVLLSEAKEWARIDDGDTSHDTSLNMLIAYAVGAAEDITGRAFVERTYELNLPYFEQVIPLPWPPLIQVTQIDYTDKDDVLHIVDPSVYEVDTIQEPGRVQPKWRQFWPVITGLGYRFNPVRITYRAGYVSPSSPLDLTDNTYLPPELRLWMMGVIATYFDNPSQFLIDTRITGVSLPRAFADGVLDGIMVGTRYF